MSQWQEVLCENDINYTCNPDLITFECGVDNHSIEHVRSICYRIHDRLKQTRLIVTLPTTVSETEENEEIADCVKINLSKDVAFESRLRFNVALQLDDDNWMRSEQERKKANFIIDFTRKLEHWLHERQIESINCVYKELTQMPIESTGQWFAEKWNMWLRDELERYITSNADQYAMFDLKGWVERHAPWRCDGLIDIGLVNDNDRYDALLRTLRAAQVVKEESIGDNDSLPPALHIDQ